MSLRKSQRCISTTQQRQRLVWERAANWPAFFHWHLSKATHTCTHTHPLPSYWCPHWERQPEGRTQRQIRGCNIVTDGMYAIMLACSHVCCQRAFAANVSPAARTKALLCQGFILGAGDNSKLLKKGASREYLLEARK